MINAASSQYLSMIYSPILHYTTTNIFSLLDKNGRTPINQLERTEISIFDIVDVSTAINQRYNNTHRRYNFITYINEQDQHTVSASNTPRDKTIPKNLKYNATTQAQYIAYVIMNGELRRTFTKSIYQINASIFHSIQQYFDYQQQQSLQQQSNEFPLKPTVIKTRARRLHQPTHFIYLETRFNIYAQQISQQDHSRRRNIIHNYLLISPNTL